MVAPALPLAVRIAPVTAGRVTCVTCPQHTGDMRDMILETRDDRDDLSDTRVNRVGDNSGRKWYSTFVNFITG